MSRLKFQEGLRETHNRSIEDDRRIHELAGALGDDANFASTITNSITNISNNVSNLTLGSVSNVSLSTPRDEHFLRYDGTSNKWVNSGLISGTSGRVAIV